MAEAAYKEEVNRMDERKVAYIPIIAPDAFTVLPDGKLPGGETVSAMPLIHSIDKSVRGLKEDLWAFKKETNSAITEVRQDISTLQGEIKAINERIEGRFDVLNERIDKNFAQYEAVANEMKGDIKAINARLDTQQTKFGWYLTIFGLIITVVVAAIQLWK